MRSEATVYVDCLRDGKLVRTYVFLCPASLAAPALPDGERVVLEAKENLSTEGLAKPPFEGIKFTVRR
jgi:hypothetical protein